MSRSISVLAAVVALGVPAGASAHFVVVDPVGQGAGAGKLHVGQTAAGGHHSCFGLSTANVSERSAAVDFLGPIPSAC
jgi:hypothetical protein